MRILANYGYKHNGDMYSVTFETMGDVPSTQAPQAVDELFRLAKEAIKRQLATAGTHPTPQPADVTIPQPVTERIERAPLTPQPATRNGHGKKPQIKDPTLPATPKQIILLKRLTQQKGQWIDDLTDLTRGEASLKIDQLLAR